MAAQSRGRHADTDHLLVMGQLAGPWGVKGWLKVMPFTETQDALLDYPVWQLRIGADWQPYRLLEGKLHGKGLVVQFEGCADRDAAARLSRAEVAVWRSELPETGSEEYYWSDLIGLRVDALDGTTLGVVDHLIETGANDVLVVRGEQECLVPFLPDQVVKSVDLEAGLIRVDWSTDY
jgi:16S rRNA processing protein RimM